MPMPYTYKEHTLSEAEKLWLRAAYESTSFDPKVVKAKLRDQLPERFDPRDIDSRLYENGRLTAIGLWHIDSSCELLKAMDQVIEAIRKDIIAQPGVEDFSSDAISGKCGLSEELVARALYEIGQLGCHFYTSARSASGANGYSSIALRDDTAYDEYLWYQGLDDLLERFYVARDPARRRYALSVAVPFTDDLPSGIRGPRAQLIQNTVKPDTAFVLMAIDSAKPELEDFYNAIKDVCWEFGINAYRANDIEHQDRITDVILDEIRTCEYLIADLSHERPNVYYEVGYAHALNKKPILYRQQGTMLHFDLYVHNVPEYRNATELREKLRDRLEAITGRQPKGI